MLILKFGIIYALGALISFTILLVVNVRYTDYRTTKESTFIADTKDIARFAAAWPVTSLGLLLSMVLPPAYYLIDNLVARFAIAIYRKRK